MFAFKMGRDVSGRVYPETGVNTGFHPASHHGEREERIEEFAKINRYHVSTIPYFLERLRDTPEGDSNLLEKALILYGSPMGNPHVHAATKPLAVTAVGPKLFQQHHWRFSNQSAIMSFSTPATVLCPRLSK